MKIPSNLSAMPQSLRFVIIGISNTLLSYLVFICSYHSIIKLEHAALIAQILAYCSGIIWSYYWNSRWTFANPNVNHSNTFIRFVLSQIIFAVLSAISIGLLVDQLKFHATLSWICVMGLLTAANFLISKMWVFREKSNAKHDFK